MYNTKYPENCPIAVDVDNYASNRGLTRNQAYLSILELIKDIRSTDVEIPVGGTAVWCTNIIDSYIRDDSQHTISVVWNTKVINHISGKMPAGSFILSDLRMGKTSVKKRYVLYELLLEHIYKGEFKLSVNVIRARCNITPEEYKEYKELNRRLLLPTLADIKKYTGRVITCSKKRGTDMIEFKTDVDVKQVEKDKDKLIEELKSNIVQLKKYGVVLEG
jgi:hypothetical protein